jgi:hypothetical protein
MKLEAEYDPAEGLRRLFFVAERERYPVDLSSWKSFFLSGVEPREVELRLLRPSGFFNKLFGASKRLYIRITTTVLGSPAKAWLWSLDAGRSWGPVTRMPTKTAETLDKLVLEITA